MRWDVAERPSFSLLLVALINFMQDFCVLGRPNLTTDIQDHLFRFFTTRCNFLRVQLSTVDICKSSEKESLRETRQADERRRAKKGVLGRLGGKTEDGKIRKEGSGERRRKGKGMSSLHIFTFFCPVSLASFQAFLSGRFSTSSASVPTDGPRMVRLETGKPCILCLSEALLLNGWELPRRRVAPGGRRSR